MPLHCKNRQAQYSKARVHPVSNWFFQNVLIFAVCVDGPQYLFFFCEVWAGSAGCGL